MGTTSVIKITLASSIWSQFQYAKFDTTYTITIKEIQSKTYLLPSEFPGKAVVSLPSRLPICLTTLTLKMCPSNLPMKFKLFYDLQYGFSSPG